MKKVILQSKWFATICVMVSLNACVNIPNKEFISEIYDNRTQQPLRVSVEQLVTELGQADVIYLGEKHDNSWHHDIQVQLIEALVKKGYRPTIGFEFFDFSQSDLLNNYVQNSKNIFRDNEHDLETQLRNRLGWQNRQEWPYYWQIIETAKRYRLSLFGTDLPAGTIETLARHGQEALAPTAKPYVKIASYTHEYQEDMYEKLQQAHCGFGHDELLSRLFMTWQARNQRIAESIALTHAAIPGIPIIIIIGQGHIENNQGVVRALAEINPDIKQLTLGMVEVDNPSPTEINAAPYQYLWLTPRADRPDFCRMMKKPQSH